MKTKISFITAQKINSLHNELTGLLNNSLQKAIEIGQLLTEKKSDKIKVPNRNLDKMPVPKKEKQLLTVCVDIAIERAEQSRKILCDREEIEQTIKELYFLQNKLS